MQVAPEKFVSAIDQHQFTVEARTAVDLFTGTTRVAQEFKRRGLHVTANDRARYSAVFSDCFSAVVSVTFPE